MSAIEIAQQIIETIHTKFNYILSYYVDGNSNMSFTIDFVNAIISALLCCICLFSFARITTFFLSSRRIGFLEVMSSLSYPFFASILFFALFCSTIFKPSNYTVYQYQMQFFTYVFILLFYMWLTSKIIQICGFFSLVFLVILVPFYYTAFALIVIQNNTAFFNFLFLIITLCFLSYDCFMLVYSSQSYISNCFGDAFLLFYFCCNLIYQTNYFTILIAAALICDQIQVEYNIKKRKIESPFVVIKTFNIYDEVVKTKVYY